MINLMLQVDLEALDDCYEVVKQMKEGKWNEIWKKLHKKKSFRIFEK
jgi:hypothetical protein